MTNTCALPETLVFEDNKKIADYLRNLAESIAGQSNPVSFTERRKADFVDIAIPGVLGDKQFTGMEVLIRIGIGSQFSANKAPACAG